MSHTAPDPAEYAALARVLKLATNDTPAARCAADLVLAWWNARQCGGFDFATMWELTPAQTADHLVVMAYIARAGHGPEALGFAGDLEQIARQWRPNHCDS